MDPRHTTFWLLGALLGLLSACGSSATRGSTPAVRLGPERPSPAASSELALVSQPAQVVLSTNGQELFTCQPVLGRVLRTSLSDGTTDVVTTSAFSPWGIAYFPALGRYLICDTARPVLLLIDPMAGMEQEVVSPFRGSPVAAAPIRDGTFALVLFAEGFLAELPLLGGQARRIDPLLRDAWGLAVEPGWQSVLVTERSRGRLTRVDLASGATQVVASGLLQPTDVHLEPGGATALVATTGGVVRRVELPTGVSTILADLPGGFTLAQGRTQAELLVSDYFNGKIYALDRISLDGIIPVERLGEPTWLGVAGLGRLVVVDQTFLGGLYRVDLSGQTARLTILLEDGRDLLSIAVEPGDQNVLVATSDGKILRVSLEHGTPLQLLENRQSPSALACSPDGRKLYFAERLTATSGALTRLTELDLHTLLVTDLNPTQRLFQRVYALAPAQTGRLAVRDETGLLLFELAGGFPTGYLANFPAISGLTTSWPKAWIAWYTPDSNLDYQIIEVDMQTLAQRVVSLGSGIQPVGLGLSRDGRTLYTADLGGAAILRVAIR